jgi:hypothetical protein
VGDVGCGGIISSIIISFVGIVIIVRGCWFGVGDCELLRLALSFLLLQFVLSLQTVLPSEAALFCIGRAGICFSIIVPGVGPVSMLALPDCYFALGFQGLLSGGDVRSQIWQRMIVTY